MPPLVYDLLMAALLLGLPLAGISWFLFSWLFSNGDLDRESDSETLKASIKKMNKSTLTGAKPRSTTRFVYDKWIWFGSGFYGLAGLWTFTVIELTQFFEALTGIASWGELFDDGLVSFLISFAINQLGNMLQGLVWFTYWPAESTLLWILIAFLGYRLGLLLAKRGQQASIPFMWQLLSNVSIPRWLMRLLRRIRI